MPTSKMKTKMKNTYAVKYRVIGSMESLTPEQLRVLAEKYVKTVARATVLGKLNEIEPSIVKAKEIRDGMLEVGMTQEMVDKFLNHKGYVLEVPTQFELSIEELMPSDGENARGRKSADVFSFESDETEGESESDSEEEGDEDDDVE